MKIGVLTDDAKAQVWIDGEPVLDLAPEDIATLANMLRNAQDGWIRLNGKWHRRIRLEVKGYYTGEFAHCGNTTIPKVDDYLVSAFAAEEALIDRWLERYDKKRLWNGLIVEKYPR